MDMYQGEQIANSMVFKISNHVGAWGGRSKMLSANLIFGLPVSITVEAALRPEFVIRRRPAARWALSCTPVSTVLE
jgi:hypothetical protein